METLAITVITLLAAACGTLFKLLMREKDLRFKDLAKHESALTEIRNILLTKKNGNGGTPEA